jgi:hypothetical protein
MAFRSRSPYQSAGAALEKQYADKGEVAVTATGLVLSVDAGPDSSVADKITLALATLFGFSEKVEVEALTELQKAYEKSKSNAPATDDRRRLPN